MTGYNAHEIAAEAKAKGEDPLSSVIAQAVGAASMCWEDMSSTGVFNDAQAKAIYDSVVEYLHDVGVPQRKGENDYARIYTDDNGEWRYQVFAGNHRLISASEDGKVDRTGVLRELKREWPHITKISEERKG